MFGKSQVNSLLIDTMVFASGPAVDVSQQMELVLTDLAPAGAPLQKQSGTVIFDPAAEKLLYVIDYPGYANNGLILRGQNAWSVADIPTQGGILLGKLGIKPKRVPAESN